jgi:death on curing protein
VSLIFLTRAAVDAIHIDSLREFGGMAGVRDENALESALAQPVHASLYGVDDLFHLAATYAYHVAENQPYIDGNKRAGLLCALNFLAMNGVFVSAPYAALFDAMIAISAKRMNKRELADTLRQAAEESQP